MRGRSDFVKLVDEELESEDTPAEAAELAVHAELQNRIAAGPPAGSGISATDWSTWNQYGWLCCPKKPKETCTNPDCKIGTRCQVMAAFGLSGDGEPLDYAARPACGAKNRKGQPCANKAMSGRRRCRFHGGLSTGPKTPAGRARIAAAQKLRWAIFRNEPYPAFIDPYREADEEMAGGSFLSI